MYSVHINSKQQGKYFSGACEHPVNDSKHEEHTQALKRQGFQ